MGVLLSKTASGSIVFDLAVAETDFLNGQSMDSRPLSAKIFDLSLAAILWMGLAISMLTTEDSWPNYFSFFTILTNFAIAISLPIMAFWPVEKFRSHASLSFQSMLTVYTIITGLVYNFVLRTGWVQPPAEFIGNNTLHLLVPILYVSRWVFLPKGALKWRDSLIWAGLILIYIAYSFIRGAFVGWYPYNFIDLNKITPIAAAQNSVMVFLAIAVVGLILVAIDRCFGKFSKVSDL